jgi:hypothetical protein
MVETAAHKRIERKNLKKLEKPKEEKVPEVLVPKAEKKEQEYCLTCKQFQKNPSGFCKFHKEHRPRKHPACDKYAVK